MEPMNGPDDNDDLLDRTARTMADAPPEEISRTGHSSPCPVRPVVQRPRPHITPSVIASVPEPVLASSIISASTSPPSGWPHPSSSPRTAMAALTWALFQSRPVLAFSIVADHFHNARTMSADLTVQESNIALTGKLLFSAPSRFRLEFAGMPPRNRRSQGRTRRADRSPE